jgi:hypothetical protein
MSVRLQEDEFALHLPDDDIESLALVWVYLSLLYIENTFRIEFAQARAREIFDHSFVVSDSKVTGGSTKVALYSKGFNVGKQKWLCAGSSFRTNFVAKTLE